METDIPPQSPPRHPHIAPDAPSEDNHPPDPGQWLALHGEALHRYAILRLSCPADAEEAVQETLTSALQARDDFRGDSTERTWLIGILRHKALNILRRRARTEQCRAEIAAALHNDPGAFMSGIWRRRPPDWTGLDAAAPAEHAELLAALREEINALPEPMRAVIVLREIDELPSNKVCDILGISRTNLWTLTHRAKIRLRERLTARLFETDDPPPAKDDS